jgi:hypothetical protein
MDGKLDCRRGKINALGGLVYLHDSKTKEKFLVDTGAAVSVLPHTSKDPSTGPPPLWSRWETHSVMGFNQKKF